MLPTKSCKGVTRLITSRIVGGTVTREFHENGHERAFRNYDNQPTIEVSYGPRGAWRPAEVGEVPDEIWYLLIDGARDEWEGE